MHIYKIMKTTCPPSYVYSNFMLRVKECSVVLKKLSKELTTTRHKQSKRDKVLKSCRKKLGII